MAGYEYEAQEVVANVIVNCGFEIRHGHLLLGLDLAAEFFVLALEPLVSAQEIDCAMLRGGHQPGARVVRNSRFRPLLKRGDESAVTTTSRPSVRSSAPILWGRGLAARTSSPRRLRFHSGTSVGGSLSRPASPASVAYEVP